MTPPTRLSEGGPGTPPPTDVRGNGAESVEDPAEGAEDAPGEFQMAVNAFITEAGDRLSPLDAPSVVMVKALAKRLDQDLHPPLVQQFGLAMRALRKQLDTEDDGGGDPVEGFLEGT